MFQKTTAKVQFWLYRLSTVLKSLKILYCLPQEKIDAFMDSYSIYDHDWADEDELIEKMGANYYKEIQKKLVDYYSVLNHLCSLGQVEKMYIPPALDLSKSIIANQVLYERKMCKDLEIKKGDQVLDIGCGRGRIASHVASFTGAHVTGLNIDLNQLESARCFIKGIGLEKNCAFIHGDQNATPFLFADSSLDAIYEVQALSLCKNLKALFKELHRILKPGGKIACLDWARLPNYSPENPHHADLMRRVKPLIGAIGTPSIEEYTKAFEESGFEILINENASIDGLQAPLIENADKFFNRVTRIIHKLVKWKLLPKHFKVLFDRLIQDGPAFVEADRLRISTSCHYIVAKKVENVRN